MLICGAVLLGYCRDSPTSLTFCTASTFSEATAPKRENTLKLPVPEEDDEELLIESCPVRRIFWFGTFGVYIYFTRIHQHPHAGFRHEASTGGDCALGAKLCIMRR